MDVLIIGSTMRRGEHEARPNEATGTDNGAERSIIP